jgi:hypothetical protein
MEGEMPVESWALPSRFPKHHLFFQEYFHLSNTLGKVPPNSIL